MPFDIKTDLRVQYFDPGTVSYVSIQADSYEIDIDRGIEIERNVFARPKVGIATVKMSKKSLYDLLNSSGPAYKSNYTFRIQYKNSAGTWNSIFEGVIQNFEIVYNSVSKKLDITIVANDLMKIGLNTQLTSYTISGTTSNKSFKNQMAGVSTAINAIDSRWVLTQNGSGGSSTTMRANTLPPGADGISTGEIFTKFLDAELGWMFIDRNNNPKYMTRPDINSLQSTPWDTLGLATTVSNVHSTADTHVCMDYMNLSYNSDDIANQVRVTETATGVRRTVTNSSSVTAYGRQLADFEVDFDNAGASTYATWATEVSNAANPRRLSGVSVPVILDSGEASRIAIKDIGDTLQIEFAATGFTTMQEVTIISSINHVITAEHWEMNIGLWEGM